MLQVRSQSAAGAVVEPEKVYALAGTLFFGNGRQLASLFPPLDTEPRVCAVDISALDVADRDGWDSVNALIAGYAAAGKTLRPIQRKAS